MEDLGTTHEDRLRALGWYLDSQKLDEISLTYSQDGIALMAHRQQSDEDTPIQLNFAQPEIVELCRQGVDRRGSGAVRAARPSRLSLLQAGQGAPAPLSQWVEQTRALSYQEALRAIGFDLDRWGAQWYRIDDKDDGVVIRYRTTTNGPEINQVYPISREEVRARIARSIRRRGSKAGSVPMAGTGS